MNNEENKSPLRENAAAGLKMDYDQPEDNQNIAEVNKNPQPAVGLSGGQAKGDPRGLDISSYTGPDSKASNDLDPEQALGGTHHDIPLEPKNKG